VPYPLRLNGLHARVAGLKSRCAWALTLGAALFVGMVGPGCAREQERPAQGGPPPPAPVEVAAARGGELVDEWVFVGELRSLRSAELALGAGGEIVMIDVREGDRVEAGTLLVEIDKRQASARLSAAVSGRRESERELEQARREAERAAALGSGILPGEEIEQQASRADSLEARKLRLGAEISAAKADLSDYQLAAPFAGVIAARYADLGQWVDPGETVLELVATEEVEVLVDIRPELAAQVHAGDHATLRPSGGLQEIGDLEAATAPAEVLGVVPSLDPGTRTLKVRLRPLESRRWLLPGAPVDVGFAVHYQTANADQVIVPRDALVLGAVDTRVLIVVDGAAKPIQVEVRATAGEEALVIGPGLTVGSVVVTRGNERLRPGQPVQVLAPKVGDEEPAS
jgi:RND family efflux transporter MFP subunit